MATVTVSIPVHTTVEMIWIMRRAKFDAFAYSE